MHMFTVPSRLRTALPVVALIAVMIILIYIYIYSKRRKIINKC